MQHTKLVRHKFKNTLHTILLLIAMTGVLALLGWMLAGISGLIVAAVVGVLSLLFSPRISPRLIFRLYRARRLHPSEAPIVYRIVERLAERADLEHVPEVYYLPTRMMNAITVGQKDEATIGVTDGLLRGLELDEFAGVIAHEIAHIANDDTRVMGIADLIGRLTSFMSSVGKLLLFINLPLYLAGAATLPWGIVIVLLVAPIASTLLQLALSRTREFDADLNAVRLTGQPGVLASGLEKLEKYNESLVKHLLMPGYGRSEPSILRTHPHTEARVQRLEDLAKRERDRMTLEEGDQMQVQRKIERVDDDPRWRPLGIWS